MRTDRNDEAKSCFAQFCERAYNEWHDVNHTARSNERESNSRPMLPHSALTFLLSFPWRSGVGSEQFPSHIYNHTSFAVSVWLYKTQYAKHNKIFEDHILLGSDIVNSVGSVLTLHKNTKRDFRLPPRCQWDLRCSGILRRVKTQKIADLITEALLWLSAG